MYEETSYSWKAKDGSRIRVGVEPSHTHPNVCRFVVEPEVYSGGAIHVSAAHSTGLSPLAARLIGLQEVSEVLVAGDAVTVSTEQPAEWQELGEKVASEIRHQLDSGEPAVAPEHKSTLPSSEEIRKKVQEVIDAAITPAVASHGGQVNLLDVKENNIYLEFGGGCQGCGMSHVTLKFGVEKLLRQHVPAIGEILDTTDHAGGKNPYYAPNE